MQPLGTNDPRRIGDYRLLGVLGSGGMGRVYLGRNSGGRTVAVKVIRPDLIGDGEFRTRFRREVTAARRVDGKFTAPVLDADVDADPPWLATGYVAGFSLSEAVERFGTFTEDAVLVLARGLAEALAAIHGAGVVHRDLKPSNVLLALDGPKVIDFGIARAVEDTALTTTGKVIGSPGFMCPEQVTGEPVGPSGDVFALGGVLVFAATGQGPFGVGDTVHMLWRVVYEEPRLDAVPDSIRPLIASCLVKDVEARPTPGQLLDQLSHLGVPDSGGWLPTPVLHEVSRRAVQLLDLDSGQHDRFPELRTPYPAAGSVPHTPPPTSGLPPTAMSHDSAPRSSTWPGPAGDSASALRRSPQPEYAPTSNWTPSRPMPQPDPYHGGRYDQTVHAGSQQSAPAPAPAPKNRTRAALIAGLLVTAIVVALGAFFIGTHLQGGSGDTAASETASEETTDAESTETESTDTSSEPQIPATFVGSWRGTAKDALFTFDIELVLGEGGIGDDVGESSNTGTLSGGRCVRAEKLTSVNETAITLTAHLTENAGGCTDEGSVSTVRLQADGSLSYNSPSIAGPMTGILRKVS